jgi:hypothetical protein
MPCEQAPAPQPTEQSVAALLPSWPWPPGRRLSSPPVPPSTRRWGSVRWSGRSSRSLGTPLRCRSPQHQSAIHEPPGSVDSRPLARDGCHPCHPLPGSVRAAAHGHAGCKLQGGLLLAVLPYTCSTTEPSPLSGRRRPKHVRAWLRDEPAKGRTAATRRRPTPRVTIRMIIRKGSALLLSPRPDPHRFGASRRGAAVHEGRQPLPGSSTSVNRDLPTRSRPNPWGSTRPRPRVWMALDQCSATPSHAGPASQPTLVGSRRLCGGAGPPATGPRSGGSCSRRHAPG